MTGMMRVHWQAPQAGHHHFENEWSLELLHAVLLQTTALSERYSEKLCEC